jgi:hypothetical protein
MRDVINIRPIFLQSKGKNVVHSTTFVCEIRYEISPASFTVVFFMKCKVAVCTDYQHPIFGLGLVFSQCATQALPSIWKTKIYTNFW